MIAKTGTAEFDRGGKRLTHAWMIAGQGDLAVCAFVDVGQTGAGTAGPLLEQFLRGALAALSPEVTPASRRGHCLQVGVQRLEAASHR